MTDKMIVLILFFSTMNVFSQDKPVYALYNHSGKSVGFDQIVEDMANVDVVLFGEMHDNPISQWMALQLVKELYGSSENLVMGMEMFEADDQLVLNEYLHEIILEEHLLREAKVWKNYKSGYKPLIEFAKENEIDVIATNIPRRYANLVYRSGLEILDSLSEEAKKYIAPLPIAFDDTLPGYKGMAEMMEGHMGENIAVAQAIKDATMAHFILDSNADVFFHLNGSYHSKNREGIGWHLKQYRPDINILTIHSVSQEDIGHLDDANIGTADYIIVIPEDMIKTY